jgi:hypothetical protein
MNSDPSTQAYGPWNPGIGSDLPREYVRLSTMFRPENTETTVEQARELSDFCGIAPHDLVAFRADRLIVHELLIRVTADLSVPDGPNDEDLGINFRGMTATVLEKYIAPHRDALIRLHDAVRDKAAAKIASELSRELRPGGGRAAAPQARGSLRRLVGGGRSKAGPNTSRQDFWDRERRVVAEWRRKREAAEDPLDKACYDALTAIVTAIASHRGRLVGDRDLITRLAVTMVCNGHGSDVIGQAIDPYVREAADREGYRLLPRQAEPVVMNVKGASASGKSTMRPLQRTLAERLHVPWHDFALISPDIWRKFLLDYESLGAAYKYAGTMTGHELEVIDKKLDLYMANKAVRGRMSHLLIDRFRFDSFVPEADGDETSKLLTRFGNLIYLFFMITPPHATVERAWRRGLKVGRYKAVDDLLYHNIEAYVGMPQLFLTWALKTGKRVHYEFLDNSVAEGRRPRTVAYGWNGEMNILDIKCLIDVDRFRKVNVDARTPEDVHAGDDMAPENNLDFLRQCARWIPVINFADFRTGYVYAQLKAGAWTHRDEDYLARACEVEDVKVGLEGIGSDAGPVAATAEMEAPRLDVETAHTLGAWGAEAGARLR